MGILIVWMEEAEQAAGVFGEAQARLAAAEQDLIDTAFAAGATVLGGIYYFFGQQNATPPANFFAPGFMPVCVATRADGSVVPPGGGDEDDDVLFDWDYYDDWSDDPGGGPPGV